VLGAAFDAGVTLFDTADAYGCGTAERLIGENLSHHRDEITIVSKWGYMVNEDTRQLEGSNAAPAYINRALEASLRRLCTDHLDLYLLHLSDLPIDQANNLLGTLADLVKAGKIRGYGWSTDDPMRAAAWVGQPAFAALEFEINVVRDAPELVELCDHHGCPRSREGRSVPAC
jgi:aryl-alcohol dehydrogenase-like predicted oxidoreductase